MLLKSCFKEEILISSLKKTKTKTQVPEGLRNTERAEQHDSFPSGQYSCLFVPLIHPHPRSEATLMEQGGLTS